MNKFLTLVLALTVLVVPLAFSQEKQEVFKEHATGIAFKTKDVSSWSDWTEWKKVDILVVRDYAKQTYTFYANKTQHYDVVKIFPKEIDSEGNENYSVLAVDDNGVRCMIRRKFVKDPTKSDQIYVEYSDMIIAYAI